MEDNWWGIGKNVELELYKDMNTGAFIKLQHLKWLGYLKQLGGARNTNRIYLASLHQKWP